MRSSWIMLVACLLACSAALGGEPDSSRASVTLVPPTYSLTDLGVAQGYVWSGPRALSSDAGYVGLETLAQGKASMYERAALLHLGTFAVFGTLGGVNSEAQGINTSGVLVGSARNASQMEQAFWTSGGIMAKLPGLGGAQSWAYAINDAGLVVGTADDAAGVPRAVSWKAKKISQLGNLGGQSQAFAVNAAGQAVGSARTPNGIDDPVKFAGGHAIDLLGAKSGSGFGGAAYGLNDTGQIVGGSGSNCGNGCTSGAWLWTDGIFGSAMLGLGAGGPSDATSINDHWQIVGTSASAAAGSQSRGYLFTCGQDYDLTGLLDATSTGWTVGAAISITNDGVILADALPPGQTINGHMVLLTPTSAGTCDTTPPTGTVSLDGGALSTTQPTVSVHQDSSDEAPSGVLEWRLSDSPTTDTTGRLIMGESHSAPFNQYSPNPSYPFDITDPAFGGTAVTGTKTIYAQWRDWSGNWSVPLSAQIGYQPTVSVSAPQPVITEGGQLSTTIPITYTWTPSNPSTLNGYTAEQTADGATYTPLTLAQSTQATAAVRVAPGSHDRIAVQGSFTPGGFSGWSASPLYQPQLHQESWTALHPTGTWTQVSSTSFSGGGAKSTSQTGAYEQFTFTGRGVAWVAQTGSGYGSASIYVDGTLVATPSLASTTTNKQIIFSRAWPTSGSHTVKIVDHSGTIDLDAIITLK